MILASANGSALSTAESNLAFIRFVRGQRADAQRGIDRAIKLFLAPTSESLSLDWRRGAAIADARAAEISAVENITAAQSQAKKAINEFRALLTLDPNDRKTAIALAQVLLQRESADSDVYSRAKALLLPLSVKQPDAEVLDPLVRTHLLLREFDAAHTLQLQLDAMGYKHPNYRAFLALHSEGTAP